MSRKIGRKVMCGTAVLLIAAAAAGIYIVKPPQPDETVYDLSQLTDYRENPVSEEEKVMEKAEKPVMNGERKDGFLTILLAGLDLSGNLTDTIAAVTLDTENRTAAVLNLPRDTIAAAPSGGTHKLNAAYGCGGIEETKREAASLTGYSFDRYAVIDYDAFKEIIDTVGGVELEIPEDMYKNTGDMVIDLKAGKQTLDGEHALMYMRYRGYAMADLDRIEAQRKLLSALVKKVARPGIILKLPALAQTVLENIDTDMTPGEMIWLGLRYADMDADSIVYNTLPCTAQYIDGISYVVPKKKEIIAMINEVYNPLKEDVSDIRVAAVPASKKADTQKQEPVMAPEQKLNKVPDWLR